MTRTLDYLVVALLFVAPLEARAVFINEVMSNPGQFGDWNGDGSGSSVADEYVELVNPAALQVDISGWTLSDALEVRHVFEAGTILPAGGSIVVFGGGTVSCACGLAAIASTGALGLSNEGDSVVLEDATAAQDSVTFGVATAGQSFNRNPDASDTAPLVLHSVVTGAVGGGSPGRRTDNTPFPAAPLVLPFLNELLPNPNTAVNDWNLDGIGDDAGDEFVEIVNPADGTAIDLGNWTLSDGVLVRHVFAAETLLLPGESIVVIGHGTPAGIPGLAVAASTGSLGLSNSGGDTITLRHGNLIVSEAFYLDQIPDESWNRSPDADLTATQFVLHSSIAVGGSLSSPGRHVDGTPFAAPEPDGAALAVIGALGLLVRCVRCSGESRSEPPPDGIAS
jgi:hypothetical protein